MSTCVSASVTSAEIQHDLMTGLVESIRQILNVPPAVETQIGIVKAHVWRGQREFGRMDSDSAERWDCSLVYRHLFLVG